MTWCKKHKIAFQMKWFESTCVFNQTLGFSNTFLTESLVSVVPFEGIVNHANANHLGSNHRAWRIFAQICIRIVNAVNYAQIKTSLCERSPIGVDPDTFCIDLVKDDSIDQVKDDSATFRRITAGAVTAVAAPVEEARKTLGIFSKV